MRGTLLAAVLAWLHVQHVAAAQLLEERHLPTQAGPVGQSLKVRQYAREVCYGLAKQIAK